MISKISNFYGILAGVVLLASSFHFWPFEHIAAWALFNPANICMFAGTAMLLWDVSVKKENCHIPHVSIIVFILVNFMSIAFAESPERSLKFSIKLCSACLGGYYIFSKSLQNRNNLKFIFEIAIICLSVSAGGCLVTRFAGLERFGFFESPYKYGSYTSVMAMMVCVYLIHGNRREIFSGWLVMAGTIFSFGNAGGLFAVILSSIVTFFMADNIKLKLRMVVMLAIIVACGVSSDVVFDRTISNDIGPGEKAGVDLKQRYIEWQAEINLLEKKTVGGTGAGCINDFRSLYYYRLPKLNTLKPFDQNGFLTIAGETGVMGIFIFCWILFYHGRVCIANLMNAFNCDDIERKRMVLAIFSMLVTAAIIHAFSSLLYNGVIVCFALSVSLVASVERLNCR